MVWFVRRPGSRQVNSVACAMTHTNDETREEMDASRREQILRLQYEALERPAAERSGFIEDARTTCREINVPPFPMPAPQPGFASDQHNQIRSLRRSVAPPRGGHTPRSR